MGHAGKRLQGFRTIRGEYIDVRTPEFAGDGEPQGVLVTPAVGHRHQPPFQSGQGRHWQPDGARIRSDIDGKPGLNVEIGKVIGVHISDVGLFVVAPGQ